MKKLYLVTNSDKYSEEEFLEKIEGALKGGVDILQLREKDKTDLEILNLGKKVKALCDSYKVPMLIDDKPHLAWALGLGVHLGADDLPMELGRKLLGKDALIGSTAKTVEAAKRAENEGADYLGVGAIYETKTRVKTKRTSVEILKEIKKNVGIEVYAIGGLNYDNIDILKGSGIDGICVVSAIMDSPNVEEDTRKLKEKINKIL
ncbi:thiamine phosphate synthase [uncultured Anaerococcus sp.]|uniref:thiamine phosphate synthase n=1 Tax=uncultured Anaerococcus sp. TaxID=293428 RepID=UPI002804D5DB|nr:thiamine phosphate synthase [uncultured Anaerococcus sp.]